MNLPQDVQQGLLQSQQDVDIFKKKNAQVIEARQRQLTQIQKAQSVKSAQTEQAYVPNIQQVIENEPERSANYIHDIYTFNDGMKDTKSAVMGGFAQAGDGIVATLGTIGGVANTVIDNVVYGDKADADRAIADSIRSLRTLTAGANAYWRDGASEHTKNELAQYNELKNQEFDSDWDRAKAQAEFLATHPKLSTYLAGESLVNSAVTLGLAGGIGGASRASQMVGTGVLAGGAYVAQADDEDRVTGDTVGHALAVAGISSLLNLPSGSLESAMVRGVTRSGTDAVKKGMLGRVPAIARNSIVEGITELGDSAVEQFAKNHETGVDLGHHVLSHSIEGAILGAYSGGVYSAPSSIVGTAKKANDVVAPKVSQYTNAYNPDTMMDTKHMDYNPARVLQEEVKTINESEDDDVLAQAESRITFIDTQLKKIDKSKQQEIENASDDDTKAQLQADYDAWYKTYYQPYLETKQAIENASTQSDENNPTQSALNEIRQGYVNAPTVDINPTITSDTNTQPTTQTVNYKLDSKNTVAIGDSIANGFGNKVGTRFAKDGLNTGAVLDSLTANASKLQGKSVILSTGLSNDITNPKAIENINKQLDILSQSGADNVVVLGVADNYVANNLKGQKVDATAINAQLKQIAEAKGFTFKSFSAKNDALGYVHPNDNFYGEVLGADYTRQVTAQPQANQNVQQSNSQYYIPDNETNRIAMPYAKELLQKNRTKIQPIMDRLNLSETEVLGYLLSSQQEGMKLDKEVMNHWFNELINPNTNVPFPSNTRENIIHQTQMYDGLRSGSEQTATQSQPVQQTNTNTTSHPIGIMGDYSKKDTGVGSGDHFDISVFNKNTNPEQYMDRFMVGSGKTLLDLLQSGEYKPSEGQRYGANRDGGKRKHAGIDFDSRIGREIFLNPKYQIKSVERRNYDPKGYGHNVVVHFTDGVSLRIGHMNKDGVDAIMKAYSNTNQQVNIPKGNGKSLIGVITGAESNGSYSIANVKGSYKVSNKDVTTMTINEILNSDLHATGKYQTTPATLRSAIKALNLSGDTKYTPEIQERVGRWLMFEKRPTLGAYIRGENVSIENAVNASALEWASIGAMTDFTFTHNGKKVHVKAGQSAYGSNGADKAHTSPQEVANALQQAKSAYAKAKARGDSNEQAEIYAMNFMGGGTSVNGTTTTSTLNNQAELNQLRQDTNPSPEVQARIEELERQIANIQNQQPQTEQVAQEQTPQNKPDNQIEPVVHQDTTSMLGNSPLISTVARASMYSASQIEQLINESTDENEKAVLRTLLESKRKLINSRSTDDVNNIVANGYKGSTNKESDLGITDYVTGLNNAISTGNQYVIDTYMNYLSSFSQSQQRKANAVRQLHSRTQDWNTDFKVVPYETQNGIDWQIATGKTTPAEREAGALDVLPQGRSTNADAMYNRLYDEASTITGLYNEYSNVLNQRTTPTVSTTTVTPSVSTTQSTPTVIPIGQAVFDGNVTNVEPTGKPISLGNIQGTNVSTVGYSKIKDYQRSGNEVWVGNKFNYDGRVHKIDPNSSLSSFTKGQELADGTPATGRIFNDEAFFNVGSLGNPYSTENGTRSQHTWGADNAQDAIVRYTDLVKHYATSEANGRVTFLEDLMQLRGKKLVTDEYHANEAKFLDYLVNQMPVEYANAIAQISQQRRDGDISSKQVKENYAKAREWIENIEVSFDDETVTNYTNRKTGKVHQAVYQNAKFSQKPQTKEERYKRMGIVNKKGERIRPKIENTTEDTGNNNDDNNSQKTKFSFGDLNENVSISNETVEFPSNGTFTFNVGNDNQGGNQNNNQDGNQNQDNDTGLNNNRKKKVVKQASAGMTARKQRTNTLDPNHEIKAVKLDDIVQMDKPNDIYQVLTDLIDALGLDKNSPDVIYKKELILQLAQYTDNPKVRFHEKLKDNHFNLDSNVIHIGLNGDVLTNLAQMLLKQSLVDVSSELEDINIQEVEMLKREHKEAPDIVTANHVKQLQRLYDAHEKVNFAKNKIFEYIKTNHDVFTELDKDTQQTVKQLLTSHGNLLSIGLTDDKVRAFLKNVRYKVKGKSKRSSLYEYLKDVVKGFFGFGVDETNVLDTLLSAMGDIAEVKLLDSDFATDDNAKLSIFNTERKVHLAFEYGDINRNEFVVAFTQGAKTSLSKVKDLTNKIAKDPNKAVTYLLGKQMTEQQQKQLDDFLDFRTHFVQYIKEAYNTDKFSHKDLKNYIMNEDGFIDNNLLDALAVSAYNFIISNGNHDINTFDDVGFILGVDKDEEPIIPTRIYAQYKHIGNPMPVLAQELGDMAVRLLDLKETDEAKVGSIKDLGVSLGGLLISAMQIADIVSVNSMTAEQHTNNMAVVNGKLHDYVKDLNSQTEIRFINFTNNGQKVKNGRIEEIVQANKGTQGFLSELFGVDFGLRSPKLKQPKEVKRTVKGTKSLVSNLQATLIKKMQSEPIEIDVAMFSAFDRLYTSHNDKFMQMLGAKVTDEQLAKMHVNDRDSAEASAEGLRREVDNMLDFLSGLRRDTKGKFQEFWDSIYVAKNDRMHFNSNMFNMQTSLIHRMMGSYKNFRTTIDMEGVTLDNLVEHALKDGKPTKIGLYLKALGMNLEGTEGFVAKFVEGETTQKDDYKFLGHTADKIDGATFIPAFVAWLQTDEVQQAVTAMQKVLDGEKISNSDFDAINTFVGMGDMGVQSMRALVEITNMAKAMNTGTKLSTALGLGSDGVNNGIALGYIYNAVATMKSMVQTGFIPKENKWNVKSFFEATHFKDVGDYYIGFSNTFNEHMEKVKSNPETTGVLSAVEKLQPSLYTRKFAKAIVIPFGYGAGIKRLIQVASENFTKDIQKGLTSLAKNPNEESIVEFEQQLQTLLGDNTFTLPRTSEELLEFWFDGKQLGQLMGIYSDLVGGTIKSSLSDFAGDFSEVRNRNTAMHQVTFNIFYSSYEQLVRKAVEKVMAENDLSAEEFAKRGFTNKEWRELVEKPLVFMMPRVATAYGATQDDIIIDESIDKIDDALTAIEVLKRGTKFVTKRQASKTNMKNSKGELQGITINLPSKQKTFEEVGVFVNSAQIQGTDSRISASASAMFGLAGVVNLNIHDQNDSGLDTYLQAVLTQNKTTYTTLAQTHIQLNSLTALVDTLVYLQKNVNRGNITKKFYQEQLELLVIGIDMLSLQADNVMSGLIQAVKSMEHNKLVTLENVYAVQQYAGETGEYVITKKDLELVDKQRKIIDDRIATLEKELTQLQLPQKVIPTKSMGEITNHSGGAKGADTVWDNYGKSVGMVRNNHYYYHDDAGNPPNANMHISEHDYNVGKVAGARAGKRNFGFEFKSVRNKLIARNYAQVKYADMVVAVANIVAEGEPIMPNIQGDERMAIAPSVSGGTGYAVGMAILMDKPVYVYNQTDTDSYKKGWYVYDKAKDDFIPTDVPVLSKNFAGIGTRNLTQDGMNAIADVYKKTYQAITGNEFTGEFKTDEKPVKQKADTQAQVETTTVQDNPIQSNSIEIFEGNWTVQDVRSNPNKLYIFGDNTEDAKTGYKPQSTQAVIRGLPNTFGIDTKHNRYTTQTSYWNDSEFDSFASYLETAITQIKNKFSSGNYNSIVFPEGGLGTGKAFLKDKAPRIWEYLNQRLAEEFGIQNGTETSIIGLNQDNNTGSDSNQDNSNDLITKISKVNGKQYILKNVPTRDGQFVDVKGYHLKVDNHPNAKLFLHKNMDNSKGWSVSVANEGESYGLRVMEGVTQEHALTMTVLQLNKTFNSLSQRPSPKMVKNLASIGFDMSAYDNQDDNQSSDNQSTDNNQQNGNNQTNQEATNSIKNQLAEKGITSTSSSSNGITTITVNRTDGNQTTTVNHTVPSELIDKTVKAGEATQLIKQVTSGIAHDNARGYYHNLLDWFVSVNPNVEFNFILNNQVLADEASITSPFIATTGGRTRGNKIFINLNSPVTDMDLLEVVTHEYIHAMTSWAVNNPSDWFYAIMQNIQKVVTEYTSNQAFELPRRLEYFLGNHPNGDYVGIKEILTIGLTNEPVSALLMQIPYEGSNVYNVLNYHLTQIINQGGYNNAGLTEQQFNESGTDGVLGQSNGGSGSGETTVQELSQVPPNDSTGMGSTDENSSNISSMEGSGQGQQEVTEDTSENTPDITIDNPLYWVKQKITSFSDKTLRHQVELMDYLLTRLLQAKKDIKIHVISDSQMEERTREYDFDSLPLGIYDVDGSIYITKSHFNSGNDFAVVATVLHELLHMATEDAINNPNASEEVKQAYEELLRVYKHLQQKVRNNDYGNENKLQDKLDTIFGFPNNYIGEMITYTLTDPAITQWVNANLADYKFTSRLGLHNPIKALSALLDVVSRFFGIHKTNSNLSTFIRLVDKLTKPIESSNKPSKPVANLHSATQIVNNKSAIDVLKDMPTTVSDTFNNHLDSLLDKTIGQFYEYNEANKKKVDKAVNKLPTDSLIKQFGLGAKEAHTFAVLKEVFHEYIQNQKGTWATNDLLKIYNELKAQLTYENFLTNDNPSELEIKLAKQAYNAVFGTKLSQDYLAKFMALALVSEQFNGILDTKRKRIKRQIERPLFDRLMRIFDSIVNFFTGLVLNKDGKVNNQLQRLTERLAKVDVQARNGRVDMLDKAWNLIGSVGNVSNRFVKKALVAGVSKLDDDSKFMPIRLLAKYGQLAKERPVDEVLDIINTEVQSLGYSGKVPKEFRQLLIELGSNKGIQRIMESMVRFTNKVGQERQKIRDATRSALLNQFSDNGKNLTKEERTALTGVVMRADIGSLLNSMNITSLLTLLTQEDKRQTKIASLEQSILGHAFGNDMLKQAKRLSAYMSHGITTPHMVKNTTLIAMGMGHDYQVDINQVNQNLVKQLDVLVGLYAVENMSAKDKALFNDLVANERNGVELAIKLQKQLGEKSKAEFKDNPYNYQKGYVPEMTDPNRSLIWIKPTEVAKYEKEGWELVSELEQSPHDTTDKRVLMVHYDIAHLARRISGAMDMSDTHAKGSVLVSNTDPQELARIAKAIYQERINDNSSYKDFNPFEQETGLVVNFNADSSIKDYHYEMQGFVRDNYLQRNNDMFELMPMLNAQLAFRTDIKETQRKLAQVLHEDYKKNYLKNPKLFVTMTPESNDKRVIEDFALMPHAFRQEAMSLFGKDQPIVVRASVYNTVFGFREYSIVQMFDKVSGEKNVLEKMLTGLMEGITFGHGKIASANIERFVKYIVGQAKDMIVIRSGQVLLGNIIANMLLLMLHGVRPDVIVKDMIFAWREGTRYTKAQNRVLEINTLLVTAKGKEKSDLLHERNQLQIEMKQSAMARYMDAGMMSTIVEDTTVLKGQQDYASKYEKRINSFVDKIPSAVKTPIDWLMVNPNTPIYQFLADATQFSDFGAKYVLAKHLTEKKGMAFNTAISEAQDNFINFDVPSGRGMDYMNKVGLFMFTKFFIRFQKVMTRMLYEKPAQTIAQHVGVEAFTDMAGVLDPFMLFRVGNNPFEASAFSIIGASDDILTFQVLTGSW